MSSGKGRKRGHHEEEHENHERWAVSYADMVTVLMALFIVLFAISQVDQEKYIQLAQGLADGFGTSSSVPLSGGEGLVNTTQGKPNPTQVDLHAGPQPVEVMLNSDELEKERNSKSKAKNQATVKQAEQELDRLMGIKQTLESALKAKGLSDRVRFRITERGLVAAVVSDDVFFTSADARIQPKGMQVLDVLGPELAKLKESVSVEGNTNHLAVRGGRYHDNWELSAARAAAVVSVMVTKHRLAPNRMIVTGYGETRPLYPRADSRAIVANRRVDLVIVDGKPSSVRLLIPQLAKARGIDTTGAKTNTTTNETNG